MSLTLQNIIDEADLLVPNSFSSANKVTWLNEVNSLFFETVKIPKTTTTQTVSGTADYTLPTDARSRNIISCFVNNALFKSADFNTVNPNLNHFTFDDTTQKLTLVPSPTAVQTMIVRYFKVATTSFVSTTLTINPDAPPEYHWIYTLGLCERIAKAMNDVNLANNYANDFQAQLMIAQQNYFKQ